MTDKILCMVCGASAHVIKSHLKNEHGPSSAKPITYEEYVERYPDAPVLSDKAKAARRKAAAERAESTKVSYSAGKQPLGKILGVEGGLKAKNGRDIEVTVLDKPENTLFPMPKRNPSFVFLDDLTKVMAMAIEVNIPLYLFGPPGVGKTDISAQICAATNRQRVRVQHTIGVEESHIVGQWTVAKEEDSEGNIISVTKWKPGPLQLAMKYGMVYVADEYDRGHPSCLSVYQSVLEGNALMTNDADEEWRYIEPHPDFRFIGTGNTNGSGDTTGLYSSTVRQDAATFERFGIVYEVPYLEKEKEVNMLRGTTGLIKEDASKICDFAGRIREMYPHEMPLTIGPRVMIKIAQIGKMRGSFMDGIELAFANRLPPAKREAAMQAASRIFG